jgi:hypothetical protein
MEMRNAHKILVWKPGQLGRYRLRWECNIIMDPKETR